jgi:hypothetical protein
VETINALRTLTSHMKHNETSHPSSQGFILPVLAGLAAYGAAAGAMLAVCAVTLA